MWERSSPRNVALLAAALAAAGCSGSKAKKAPEADPAVAKDLATRLLKAMPSPSQTRECTEADFKNVPTITYRSLLQLASWPAPDTEATLKPWINPPQLDGPGVSTLLDATADEPARRRAAAQFEKSGKALLVYRVDMVNAPIALSVKHPIRGTVHTRTIRFDNGVPTCVSLVSFQNDKEKSDWAIAMSTQSMIDPAVAKAMQDDLTEQYIKAAPGHAAPAPAQKK
jgi:hypothetical protein